MSKSQPARGIFVTGTDTDVGKTYVSVRLVQWLMAAGYRVGVYKPAASGGKMIDGQCVCDDASRLWEAAGRPSTVYDVCPQMFVAPLAPPVAAQAEAREVDTELLVGGLSFWTDQCDVVIVEGAGGLLSPLANDRYVADVAIAMGYPLLVVTANRLGTINQTLQTLLTAKYYGGGMQIAGVVLNDVMAAPVADESLMSNPTVLRERCDVPLFQHVKHGQEALPDDVDWARLCGFV